MILLLEIFAFLCGLAFLILLWSVFEARWLKVRPLNLTAGISRPVRLAFVSDIHAGSTGVPAGKLRRVLESEKPDAILLGGDYADSLRRIPRLCRWLKEALPGGVPVYAVYGNNDFEAEAKKRRRGEIRKALESCGIRVLDHQIVLPEESGLPVTLLGLSEQMCYHPEPAAFRDPLKSAPPAVAFGHNPDLACWMQSLDLLIYLCGHFHGGQLHLPRHLEFPLLRRKDRLPRQGIVSGWHRLNRVPLMISHGVGCNLLPLRLGARPDVVILTVCPEKT